MGQQSLGSRTLDLIAVRRRVDTVLSRFLHRPAGRDAADLDPVLRDYVLAPGKRVRPLLCVIGWHAAFGTGLPEPVLRTAASLELFHACALIHGSLTGTATGAHRADGGDHRGRPRVDRALAALHTHRPDPDAFGSGVALLLGDLALVRSDELLHTAGLTPRQLRAALPLLDALRCEAVLGQYLDLVGCGPPTDDIEQALTIARLRTATYTVERPLQLGAALAGAGPALRRACTAFALPIGEAFQLRDDLLGTFGVPHVTGRPVREDLRSGRATVLMALAVRRATPNQLRVLTQLVGDPALDEAGAAAVRDVLEDTGARQAVEDMVAARHRAALDALRQGPFPPESADALRLVAAGALRRVV